MAQIARDLADKNADFGVRRVYGEAQTVDGVEFIPVAFAVSGYGGGQADGADGSAGGGIIVPLGVYVHREEGLRFEPNWVTFIVVAIPFVCVAGRALARIIRALKK